MGRAVLRSRSVFDRLRLRIIFSPAPVPAPIKSRLRTIKKFFYNIPPSSLEKINLLLSICFFKLAFNQCWNKRREHHSEFLLFYVRWSRSRTFTLAPTKKYQFRLRNTVQVTIIEHKLFYNFFKLNFLH